MDSKLVQGLLIAACLSLALATGLTVADILQYRGIEAQVPPRAMAPAPRPAPAEERMAVPAETEEAATKAPAEQPTEPAPAE
jgi:hypothetical protein